MARQDWKHCWACAYPMPSHAQQCPSCFSAQEEAKDPFAGQILGGYRLLQKIGQGGMGMVYRADQPGTHYRYAIKLLNPSFCQDEILVERLRREASLASQLQHPHIVQMYDAGWDPDFGFYLVMEMMQGKGLDDYLRKYKQIPLARVWGIVSQIGEALDHAHQKGVIHRDLKPGNVFVLDVPEPQMYVKLLDFGIARTLAVEGQQQLTGMGYSMGTPEYMPPEQIMAKGEQIGPATDLYSLAVLAFRMLTGVLPFQNKNLVELLNQVMFKKPPLLSQISPLFEGTALDELFFRALSKQPKNRLQSIKAFLYYFDNALHADPLLSDLYQSSEDQGWESRHEGTLLHKPDHTRVSPPTNAEEAGSILDAGQSFVFGGEAFQYDGTRITGLSKVSQRPLAKPPLSYEDEEAPEWTSPHAPPAPSLPPPRLVSLPVSSAPLAPVPPSPSPQPPLPPMPPLAAPSMPPPSFAAPRPTPPPPSSSFPLSSPSAPPDSGAWHPVSQTEDELPDASLSPAQDFEPPSIDETKSLHAHEVASNKAPPKRQGYLSPPTGEETLLKSRSPQASQPSHAPKTPPPSNGAARRADPIAALEEGDGTRTLHLPENQKRLQQMRRGISPHATHLDPAQSSFPPPSMNGDPSTMALERQGYPSPSLSGSISPGPTDAASHSVHEPQKTYTLKPPSLVAPPVPVWRRLFAGFFLGISIVFILFGSVLFFFPQATKRLEAYIRGEDPEPEDDPTIPKEGKFQVEIVSIPEKADVIVQGRVLGKTPLRLWRLAGQPLDFAVVQSGYDLATGSWDARSNTKIRIILLNKRRFK